MVWILLFWLGLLVSVGIGLVYFRDLGDVSQMILKVKRKNMIRFIRNEYRLIGAGLTGAIVMAVSHLGFEAGPGWVFWAALVLIAFLYGFPWVWVHLGLRNQADSARYFSVEEAKKFVAPAADVMVIEKNGKARAHPDYEMMRPHLAGNDEGLDGENVVMTYCAMANLGIGYTPEIEGEKLELEVLAQHGNNLVLRDNTTNEPIQHIYGQRESDGRSGPGMKPWPTFRMSFQGFQKAYPDGEVFLNPPSSNPFLRLLDMITDPAFSIGIGQQHRQEMPIMDNMTRYDDRLPNKTYVWGIDSDGDAVCFTREFIVQNSNLVNTQVGGRSIVLAWDPVYESVGAWYNDSGQSISKIDFFGTSDRGKLDRVESLKPGLFWHVWAEFFPDTDINRAM
jgi:uncharacterized membrane protein